MLQLLPYFLFFLLALEGLGIPNGRELAYTFLVLVSPIFFIHAIFHNKTFKIPKKITLLFMLFIGSAFLSSFLGINIQKSIQSSFVILSTFLIFLVAYNYQKELQRPLIITVILASLLFSLYSILLSIHINLPIPSSGYQFVFSKFGSHNHLGDFLVLPTIICLYNIFFRRHILLSSVFCLLSTFFIFFSYSRSAYLSVAFTTIFLYLNYLKDKHTWLSILLLRILLAILLLTTGFFLITTSHQATKQPISRSVNQILVNEGGLKAKELLGNRLDYMRQAVNSIEKNPILGVGPNNFIQISKLYSKSPQQITEVAHNIFLETLVGQGILGLSIFSVLLVLLFVESRKNVLYFVNIAMLINFQTDYTYQLYSFILLFFCIFGIIYREEEKQKSKIN